MCPAIPFPRDIRGKGPAEEPCTPGLGSLGVAGAGCCTGPELHPPVIIL